MNKANGLTLILLTLLLLPRTVLAQSADDQAEDDVIKLLEAEERAATTQSGGVRKPADQIGTLNRSSTAGTNQPQGVQEGGAALLRREPPLNAHAIQNAWDNPNIPGSGQYNPGVLVLNYRKDQVDEILVRPSMNTVLIFPSWEIITPESIPGSLYPDALNVTVDKDLNNIVYITPTDFMGIDGTLTLKGRPYKAKDGSAFQERNIYHYYVRSVSIDYPEKTDLIVHVRAKNPLPLVSGRRAQTASLPEILEKARFKREPLIDSPPDYLRDTQGLNLASLRYSDYRMFVQKNDDRDIAPLRIFHDGRFTYFDFGEDRADQIDMPAVYQVMDGVESPTNYSVTGPGDSILAVQAIGNFSLRHGSRLVCVRCFAEGLCTPAPAPVELVGR